MSHPHFVDPATYPAPLTRPEKRGIETISTADRHGRARDLFAVWAAPNVSVLNFTVGATLVLLGLNLWQAFLVILAGSLPWIFTGIVAVSGPAAGTSASVITRAIYGVRGNKVVVAFYSWPISAAFLALNWLASSFMGAQLLSRAGVNDPVLAPVAVTLVVAAVTVLVAVYGHSLIFRSYPVVALVLTAVFLVATLFLLPQVNWSYSPAEPLDGTALWSAVTVGFTVLASTPLSFSNSPDMARYLPVTTKASQIITATALGGALPSIVFTMVGALLATAIDPAGMDAGIESVIMGLLPAWLGPLFVIGIIVNTISLNGRTTYTASMAFQSIGVPVRRIPAAILVGVIGTALTVYLVISTSLLEAVNLMLQVLVLITGPTMSVFVTDVLLRRNRYNGQDLFKEHPGAPFWFSHGWSIPGLVSVLLGGAAASLFLTSGPWTGPLAQAMGGIDVSVPVSLIVTATVYAALTRGGMSSLRPSPTRQPETIPSTEGSKA